MMLVGNEPSLKRSAQLDMSEIDEMRRRIEELTLQLADANQLLRTIAKTQLASVPGEERTDEEDREESEKPISQSERLVHGIFGGVLDALLLTDDQGRIVDATPAACELFGLERRELRGRHFGDFSATPLEFGSLGGLSLAENGAQSEFELRRADGTTRQMEYTARSKILPGIHIGALRDITERKRTEAALHSTESALRASEARFRGMIEKSSEAIWVIGADGIARYVSPSIRLMLGVEAPEVVGTNAVDWIIPEDREYVATEMGRLVLEPSLGRVLEFRVRHKDGSIRWVESAGSNMLDDPAIGAIVANSRDVTERRVAEQALRDSQYMMAQAQAVAHIGSWASGSRAEDRISWSQECARIFARDQEAPPTRQEFFGMIHPDDMAMVIAANERALAEGIPCETEHRILLPDGRERWVYGKSVVQGEMLWADGRPVSQRHVGDWQYRTIGVVQDITERRRATEARNRLAVIVESTDDAILSTDLDGVVMTWNRGAERLYGYTAEEVVGKTIDILIEPGHRTTESDILAQIARGDSVRHHETTRMRKDGLLVDVSLTMSPIRDSSGKIIGASKIVRDLTEKREAEARLRRTEEQLRQAQKMEAIGRLAGGLAHDFNNMLFVILGYAGLALDELKPDENLHANLTEVARAGQKAARLTKQLLAFSRKQILEPQVLDLSQSVRGLAKILQSMLGEGIELSLVVEQPVGAVFADPGQIDQVLMNLVVNARDAMPDGGSLMIETANVELDAASPSRHEGITPGAYVMLAVSDTGTGMDEATATQIFEPFFTTKEQGKGTGLGLSTVFGIVKQSGGHILVYSEPGQGTTFKVYFPRTERLGEAYATTSSALIPLRGTETILLVEDDTSVRMVMRTILRKQGYNVLEAMNGGEALLICEQHGPPIHMLLTDVVMPRMNGRQLAERLTPMRPEMKVLYVSGYTEDAIVHQGVLETGIAYMQKPITPDTLTRKVREVFDAPPDAR